MRASTPAKPPGVRAVDARQNPGSGLIPIALGEVRRLLAHLITTIPARAAIWAWSRWRRRHQHPARASHYQRKHAQYNEILLE